MKDSPIIGISAGSGDNFPNRPELYVSAVQRAGGMAEFIYAGTGKKGLADHYDGFLIPGGNDIAPLLYNELQLFGVNPEEQKRTDFEMFLLNEAVKRKRPVLGICYGMQVINVFFRGTLYQDIASQKDNALDHKAGVHAIEMRQNPFFISGEYDVNSSHHQAVKDTGKNIKPFAYASDGIIEALYLDSYPFLVGVQWHPERMDNEISAAVFGRFMEACRERA
jgi:putative glutamine amidotransferase